MYVVMSSVLQCELFIWTSVRSLGSKELFWTVVADQIVKYSELGMVFVRSIPRRLMLFWRTSKIESSSS